MSPRARLLLLATLFFAPVIGAIVLYFYLPQYIPEGRTNFGTLISPARALPKLQIVDAAGAPVTEALKGKWTLVYLGGASCDEACTTRLVLERQVRLALAEKRTRVQRVYLAPSVEAATSAKAALAVEHADMVFLVESAGEAAKFFQPSDPNALYLLDPLGNWLMVYTGEVTHKGLHRDIKKLLRVSQVG